MTAPSGAAGNRRSSAEADHAGGAAADRGAVTVEAAIGIGAVMAVFLLVLAAFGVLLGQLRCTDAAVEAARLAARGDHDGARAAVARSAPTGSELVLAAERGLVIAEVTAPSGPGLLPQQWRSSRAAAAPEPEAPAATAPEPPGQASAAPQPDAPIPVEPGSDEPDRPPAPGAELPPAGGPPATRGLAEPARAAPSPGPAA
ncbi:TadE family type IV pilus minor pilin [Saccharopolyspora sp. 6V]|uniref:TadE family type IV pilus minor pilin n=1 Tax=Saccharopolyspora sp. 6V TaxID=2877239 RepID=UPI001CD2563F|nr:TadE family type IV pilus minor pilin [Saccharopolyspora sp. 6V]MCA1193219.1 hypothetical protein [Saccharopolyspora sp. 6V]